MKLFTYLLRPFRTVVMLHKIAFIRLYDWQQKRGWRQWKEKRAFILVILPELLLIFGTLHASPVDRDGYLHITHTWQEVVLYTAFGWAVLVMWAPTSWEGTDKKLRREVRQALCERPRYWLRAAVIYLAAIVAAVVAVHILL